jgi:hypothetical protein
VPSGLLQSAAGGGGGGSSGFNLKFQVNLKLLNQLEVNLKFKLLNLA